MGRSDALVRNVQGTKSVAPKKSALPPLSQRDLPFPAVGLYIVTTCVSKQAWSVPRSQHSVCVFSSSHHPTSRSPPLSLSLSPFTLARLRRTAAATELATVPRGRANSSGLRCVSGAGRVVVQYGMPRARACSSFSRASTRASFLGGHHRDDTQPTHWDDHKAQAQQAGLSIVTTPICTALFSLVPVADVA